MPKKKNTLRAHPKKKDPEGGGRDYGRNRRKKA